MGFFPFWPETNHTAAIIDELRASKAAGDWSVVPNYPRGHVQIADHLPWRYDSFVFVAITTCVLLLIRELMSVVVPPLAKLAAVVIHGNKWLASEHARGVDWRRFSDVVHCTVLHAATSAYVAIALRDEMLGWYADTSQWWAFMQPALSEPLRVYYLLELGVTCEACISMTRSVLRGRAKDLPMVVHHAATLFVFLASHRNGFVRVGAAVVSLHDVSDLPIDGIRIGQALQLDPLLYLSALLSVVSWGYFRAWCFPRYIISSALLRTEHLYATYSAVGTPHAALCTCYAMYIVPLVVLWVLSCYWLWQLSLKLHLALVNLWSPASCAYEQQAEPASAAAAKKHK